jgi:hypothetical protein
MGFARSISAPGLVAEVSFAFSDVVAVLVCVRMVGWWFFWHFDPLKGFCVSEIRLAASGWSSGSIEAHDVRGSS